MKRVSDGKINKLPRYKNSLKLSSICFQVPEATRHCHSTLSTATLSEACKIKLSLNAHRPEFVSELLSISLHCICFYRYSKGDTMTIGKDINL